LWPIVFFQKFIEDNNLREQLNNITNPEEDAKKIEALLEEQTFKPETREILKKTLEENGLLGENLAVRSSGLDEDSKRSFICWNV
jgi:hypothetical protein